MHDDRSHSLFHQVPLGALALAVASIMFLGAVGGIVGMTLFASHPSSAEAARVTHVSYTPLPHPHPIHNYDELTLYNSIGLRFPGLSPAQRWQLVHRYERATHCCPPPRCCCPRNVMAHAPPPPQHAWPLLFAGLLAAAALGASFVTRRRTLPMHP